MVIKKRDIIWMQQFVFVVFLWIYLPNIIVANSGHSELIIIGNSNSDTIIGEFFNREDTKVIIVIQKDSLLFEHFYSDCSDITDQSSPLFERLTVISLLEIALNEGYIYSMKEPVRKYLPELSEKDFSSTSLSRFLNLNQENENYYALNIPHNLTKKCISKKDTFQVMTYLYCLIVERATGVDINEYFESKIIDQINNLRSPFIFNGFKEDSDMISCCGFLMGTKNWLSIAQLFLQNEKQNTLLIKNGDNCLFLSKSKKLVILWVGKGKTSPDFYEFSKKLSGPG